MSAISPGLVTLPTSAWPIASEPDTKLDFPFTNRSTATQLPSPFGHAADFGLRSGCFGIFVEDVKLQPRAWVPDDVAAVSVTSPSTAIREILVPSQDYR